MKMFYVFALLLFGSRALSQWKQLPISSIYKTEIKLFKCLDSSGRITESCLTVGAPLDVNFFQVFIDSNKKMVRLIGRTVFTRQSPDGFPGIGIYFTEANDNLVRSSDLIYDTDDYKDGEPMKGGFFDMTISLKSQESLFFHNKATRLLQFEVHKLFKN